ncbi:hypothetical protein PHYC_02034 [Phycisphaerales bacterium]|nr:hypothetical protein PHYC_02034 [Phycisphaerales bacterium]
MGLPFDGSGGPPLISVCAAYAAVVVAERLRAKLPAGRGSVGEEFASIIAAIGGSPDLARTLATELGPALVAAVGQDANPVAPQQKSQTADSETWQVDYLSVEMIRSGESRPKSFFSTLKRVHASADLAPERFQLFADESNNDGLVVRQASGAEPSTKDWDSFAGQSGLLLRLTLTALGRGEYKLDSKSTLTQIGSVSKNSGDPSAPLRRVRMILNSRLDGLFVKLLRPRGKKGCWLNPVVSYCWIRCPAGRSRFG